MLFELFCDVIYDIITGMLFWLEFPVIESFDDLELIFELAVTNGVGIFNFFVGGSTVGLLFEIWVSMYALLRIYDLVMWLLKKIPMLGIK